jgi:hypothetical protein
MEPQAEHIEGNTGRPIKVNLFGNGVVEVTGLSEVPTEALITILDRKRSEAAEMASKKTEQDMTIHSAVPWLYVADKIAREFAKRMKMTPEQSAKFEAERTQAKKVRKAAEDILRDNEAVQFFVKKELLNRREKLVNEVAAIDNILGLDI